jgi:murein DD-endopeptidase MepM/ murein hydrolase activator NlpD
VLAVALAVSWAGPGRPVAGAGSAPTPESGLRVVDREVPEGVELAVVSTQVAPVTLSITVAGKNAAPDREMPVVVSCPGPGKYPFVILKPVQEDQSFSWKVKYDWRFGQVAATHDPKLVYALPFKSGQSFVIGQGFHGTFTHSGNDEFAVDFDLPIGTEVLAARSGTVVLVVDKFDRGGPDLSLREKANYVLVRHDDGTLGEYVHLKRDGARVKPGQGVRVGDLIGLSGDVGYSRGAHLHFAVFRAVNGIDRETFPMRFKAREGEAIEPVEGARLTAP